MSTVPAETEAPGQSSKPQRRRGCLSTIGRGLKWFTIILVILTLSGLTYQAIASEMDKNNFSPRGQLYTVNGHRMHMVCMGEGSPPVILQAGASAESLWWHRVQNQLAQHTQVCAYDRPGMGWSEPVDGPRDVLTINHELHAMLEQAGIPAPYIMAGHSFGAILTRVYAAQYPEEVGGIVLVDSQPVNPKQFASQGVFDQYKSFFDLTQAAGSVITRLGLMRLMQPATFLSAGYPADIVPELVGLQARNQVLDAYYAENGPAFPALQEASASAENLGDLPMAVLWASETNFMMERIPTLAALHDEIPSYSSNSVVITIQGANHGSILGNEEYAQQVSDAVLAVIEAAETDTTLASSTAGT